MANSVLPNLSGSEKTFSAGADIGEMAAMTTAEQLSSSRLFALWDRVGRFQKPIVAALSGHVLGGGLELAMCCDILILKDSIIHFPSFRTGLNGSLAVINAAQIVTNAWVGEGHRVTEDTLRAIQDGAMLVEDGKVSWVGTTKRFRGLSVGKPTRLVDAGGRLVTPGFVDCHSHLVFAGSREDELERKLSGEDYLSILSKGGGIRRTIRETRAASVSQIVTETRQRIRQLVKRGYTTIEIKTGYGQDLRSELKLIQAIGQVMRDEKVGIVPTFLGLHAVPKEFRRADDYVSYTIREVLPRVGMATPRPLFSDCFCEEGIFPREACRRYLEASRAQGFRLKVHADEFGDSQGASLAAETGCISADHLEYSSREGIEAMMRAGVIAGLLPATPFYSNIRQADAKMISEVGCRVALGSDICPNAWVESPQFIMALACNEMRMTPAEALAATTCNAAAAIGQDDTGRLVKGAPADFVIHDFPNYRFLPYRVGGDYVWKSFKGGELVYGASQ